MSDQFISAEAHLVALRTVCAVADLEHDDSAQLNELHREIMGGEVPLGEVVLALALRLLVERRHHCGPDVVERLFQREIATLTAKQG